MRGRGKERMEHVVGSDIGTNAIAHNNGMGGWVERIENSRKQTTLPGDPGPGGYHYNTSNKHIALGGHGFLMGVRLL